MKENFFLFKYHFVLYQMFLVRVCEVLSCLGLEMLKEKKANHEGIACPQGGGALSQQWPCSQIS